MKQKYCPTHHRYFNACCWECEEGDTVRKLPPHLRPLTEEQLGQWRKQLAESLLIERNAHEGV
jgi:hypothetical protein